MWLRVCPFSWLALRLRVFNGLGFRVRVGVGGAGLGLVRGWPWEFGLPRVSGVHCGFHSIVQHSGWSLRVVQVRLVDVLAERRHRSLRRFTGARKGWRLGAVRF